MAKSVDLRAKPPVPAAPPPPPTKPVSFPIPLPAGRVATAPGAPPVGIDPKNLTQAERKALEALGWTDDMRVPSNMADLVGTLRADATADQLPVDPAKPPPAWNPIPVEKLPPEQQAKVRQAMESMLATEAEDQAARTVAGPAVPGLHQAQQAASQSAGFQVVDDRGATDPAAPAAPAVPPPGETKPDRGPTVTPSETGADAKPAVCPHCHHNLSVLAVIEPARNDKLSFLHAMLGQKMYTKEYPLFGGRLVIGLRNLALRELDVLFRQASLDQRDGKFQLDVEYWEQVNRYRLCLQLQSFRMPGPGGLVHDLPDGLSAETNPGATAFWEVDVPEGGTALPKIQEFVFDKVLQNEAVLRIVNATCQTFNRLLARLEAMADSPDFWPAMEDAP